ncbi:MAG: cysteine hydrolase family protein [Micromonosporaceae bacterium]
MIGPDERLIASRYQSRRQLGEAPGLLLIDCYRKVFGDRPLPLAEGIEEFPATCGMAAWDALGPLTTLLRAARAAAIPVIHTTGETRPQGRLGAPTLRARRPGEDGAGDYQIVPELAPAPDELVVFKSRASAFFGTPLVTWLRQLGVDTLVVAGETTSGCVRASVVDAYSLGFPVAVVEEATFDRSQLCHQVNLFDMHLKYATVGRLEDVIGYLESAAD